MALEIPEYEKDFVKVLFDSENVGSNEVWNYNSQMESFSQVFVYIPAGVTATFEISTAVSKVLPFCTYLTAADEAGPVTYHFYLNRVNGVKFELLSKTGSGAVQAVLGR